MAQEFRLEDPGEGIHEAEIIEVHVSTGDEVADGDTILTVETDKASVEVPAPFAGVIEELRVKAGDIAKVGDVLMTYRADGSQETSDEEEKPADGEERGKEERGKKDENGAGASQTEDESKDRKKTASKTEKGDRDREAADRADLVPAGQREQPVPAAPATRRLARELDVTLEQIEASGPHGRVTTEDVRAAAEDHGRIPNKEKAKASSAEKPEDRRDRQRALTSPRGAALPDFERWGTVEREPLRSIRRATAYRMAQAWEEIPHVTHEDAADVTELEAFRREHAEAVEKDGGKLTLTIFAIKAAVAALKAHPRFNASLDPQAEEIVLKRYYNIGVAIDTEAGLYVPVVRDADRKSLIELSIELVELAERTRAGGLDPQDMRGGTFTITNPGPLGGRSFTPIINYPEAAILGLAQARRQPVIQDDDDRIVSRLLIPVCLSFDHRINDGADAARFTRSLMDTLTDVSSMILHT